MDLVRLILKKVEECCHGNGFIPIGEGWIEGHSKDEVVYHLQIMDEGGLIVGVGSNASSTSVPDYMPMRLTWYGHEVLDGIKDDGIWSEVKKSLSKVGDVASYDVLKALATKVALGFLGVS
jgi:hypothetical protein